MLLRQVLAGVAAILGFASAYSQAMNQGVPAGATSPGAAVTNSRPSGYTPPSANAPANGSSSSGTGLPSPSASGGSATVIVPAGPPPNAIAQKRAAKKAAKARCKARKKAAKRQYKAQKQAAKEDYKTEKRQADVQGPEGSGNAVK